MVFAADKFKRMRIARVKRRDSAGYIAAMVLHAVPRSESKQYAILVRKRLCGYIKASGLFISQVNHVAVAVWADSPKVVVSKLRAVVIVPAHVYYSAVGHNFWAVVNVGIDRYACDKILLSKPSVQIGYWNVEALYGFVEAVRRIKNIAVGHVARLYIVPISGKRQLCQILSIDPYFVNMEQIVVALAV